MRILALIPLLVLAACSDGAEADQKGKQAEAPTGLQAGQWETTSQYDSVTAQDDGVPAIRLTAGDKVTVSNCLAEADAKRPPAAVLAGLEDATCEYDNFYMSRGRLNATLSCTRPDLKGRLMINLSGSYTATGFEARSNLSSFLESAGDLKASAKVTGRHAGACAPAEPKV